MENTLKGRAFKKKVLQAVAKKMIQSEVYGWPPICSVFTYQPMRPLHKPSDAALEKEK